jgi:outer membrane protein TolC
MYKKSIIFILLLTTITSYPPILYSEQDSPSLSSALDLKSAILTAYKNNKDIQEQEREVGAARANILDAVSEFLPTVNLDASYTRNKKVLSQNIFSGYTRDHIAGISATESIYDGGADVANFKQSQLNLKVAQETLRAQKLDVEFSAKQLYYGLLLAYETERIAREVVDQAKAHYENVNDKFKHGTASRFDLLQSKVQVSLMMPDLINAINEANIIKAQLNKLMGVDVNTPFELKEKLAYSQIDINERQFLQEAYVNRPEMILKRLGIDINKWSIEMAKSGQGPQISMDGEYYYRSNKPRSDMFNDAHKNWYWGVSVSLPVFDGFSTLAKIREAQELYAKAVIDKDNVAEQTAVDIKQACFNLENALQLIISQKDNIEEAHEALRISEIRYTTGVGTNLDVIDSQVALGQVQKNLASGTYDYLMAEAQLNKTMGKSYITEER